MELPDHDFLLRESRLHVPGWAGAGLEAARIEKGGSDRHYYRLTATEAPDGPDSVILMLYTGLRADNLSFFAATGAIALTGARTPRIFHHDPVRKLAWLEDLGRADLWECRHDEARRMALYRSALDQAACLHRFRWESIPEALRAQLQPPFDEALYAWEQDYFFGEFAARFSAAGPAEQAAVRAGEELAALRRTLAALPRSPVHRDFQSQNLIIRDGEAWMIDYQGLRPGRPEYDVASLLYDPYVELTAAGRRELQEYYFALRREDGGECGGEILAMCACQRLMQALGAYGKIGAGDGKKAFLAHIPPALANLRSVLRESALLPSLEPILELRPGALEAAGLPPSP